MSWRRLENVFKTPWRRLVDVLKTSWKCLEDTLKTSWRRLKDVLKTSWRRLEDVWQDEYVDLDEDVLKTCSKDIWVRQIYSSWSRRLEDVLKPSSEEANIFVLIKTYWRRLQDVFSRRMSAGWWSLHKFHKCISFTSQIVRLTTSGLSNLALHRGFFFLRFLAFLDPFVWKKHLWQAASRTIFSFQGLCDKNLGLLQVPSQLIDNSLPKIFFSEIHYTIACDYYTLLMRKISFKTQLKIIFLIKLNFWRGEKAIFWT